MALKHVYTVSIKNDSATGISDSLTYTADAEANVSCIALAGATREEDVTVDVSKIKSFFIESDKDVRVDVNAEGTLLADQTFDLAAKKAFWWNTDRHDSNPLTVDITKLFFVNDGDEDANVKAGFLVSLGSDV